MKRLLLLAAMLAGIGVAHAKDVAQWDNGEETITYSKLSSAIDAVMEASDDSHRTLEILSSCSSSKGAKGIVFSVVSDVTLTLEGGEWMGCGFVGEGKSVIIGGAYDFDPSALLGEGCSASEAGGVWTVSTGHTHDWKFLADGGTLTASCSCVEEPLALTLTATGKEYDSKALTAALSGKAAFVKATGATISEIAYYKDGVATSTVVDAGSYEARVGIALGGGNWEIKAPFEIERASLTSLTLEEPTSILFDGDSHTIQIASVKAGELAATYAETAQSCRTTRSVGTWTVEVEGTGNFKGTATATWTIRDLTGEFGAVSTTSAGCVIDGTTCRVADSTKLAYENGGWTMNMTVKIPHAGTALGNYNVHPAALIRFSSADGVTTQGATIPIVAGTYRGETDVESFTWAASFTLDEIKEAETEGTLRKTLTVYEPAYSESVTLVGTLHNGGGIRETTFAIEVPLEGLFLFDETGLQVYPASHEHQFVYSTPGDKNEISCVCVGASPEKCYYSQIGSVKLVLTAEDAKKDKNGKPYAGAKVDIDPAFPVKDVEIEYYQGDVKLETAPSEVGDYVAKATVGGATAVAEFKILSRARNFDLGGIKLVAGETTGYDFSNGTLKMLDGTGWKYCAAKDAPDGSGTEGWYATFTVDWPNETLNYTRLSAAKFTVDGIKDAGGEEKRIFTGEDDIPGVEVKKSIVGAITGFVWYVRVTPEELDMAAKAGASIFTREMTAWGEPWNSTLARDDDGVDPMMLVVTTSLDGLKLYDSEGYLRYPIHDHEWRFEVDGGTLKATCGYDGCRYNELPLTLALTAGEDNGRLCNGKALAAKATCDADFETITGAAIGEIVYRNADGEALDSAPIQPGEWTASVTVTTAGGDYTVKVAIVIRAGEIVVDGIHYEGVDTATQFAKNATISISLGKDFVANGTYVIKGEKTLDLNGFKIVSAENTTIFRNEGTFAIDDLSRSGGGAMEMNSTDSSSGYLVENEGTLAIENGTFVGAFLNGEGEGKTIQLLGGVYSVEPEKGWAPDGYDIIPRTIEGVNWWAVESHEHRYQFIGFGSVMTATCSHLLIEERLFKGSTIPWTHCDAREMLMVLGGGKIGGVEYTGEPVQPTVYYVNVEELFKAIDNYGLKNLVKDLGITDVFEALVSMLKSGIGSMFNAQSNGGIKDAILGAINNTEDEQTLLNLLKMIGEGIFDSEDRFASFKSAFITQEEYEKITGAKIVGFTYYDSNGNELAEAPKDVGSWTMKATIITQKGNTVSLKKSYRIKAASIAEASIECEPAINAPLTYTGSQIDLDVKSVRIGSIVLAGYNTVDELFEAIKSGKLTALELYNILKDIGKFRDSIPTFADWLKEFAGIITGERSLEEFRADIEAMLKGRVLEPGVDYEIEGTLSATDIGEYSFTVKGIGNYSGSIKKNWSIVQSTHQFPAGAFEQLRIVTDPDTGDRTFGVKVNYYSLLALTTYVMPENARLQFSLAPDEIYNGRNLGDSGLDVSADIDKTLIGGNDYLKSVTWRIKLSQTKINAAFDAGFDELVYIVTAGALAGEGNEKGFADTAYELRINLRDYISHKHNWSVAQTDAATLTATCVNATGCGHPEPIKLAVGENGATAIAFDGEAHFAELDGAKLFTHFTGAVVDSLEYVDAEGLAVDSIIEQGVYGCTAKVTVNGETYTLVGEVEILPNREFGANALSEKVLNARCGTVDGNTMTVTNPSGLKYIDGKWYCAINIAWPNNTEQIFHAPQYTAPDDLRLEGDVAKGETTVNTAKFLRIRKLFQPEEYVKSVDWEIGFSLDDIKAAEGAGELVYTLVAGANRGENDGEGLTPTEFKVVVPIDENLVLCDGEGNQLYPMLKAQGEQLFALVTAAMPMKEVAYTGEEVEAPEVVVSYNGQKLRRGVDFVLERDFKGVKIGTYVLVIRGIGIFAGVKIDLEWEIKAEVRHNWNVRPLSVCGEACGIMSREGDTFIVTKPENLELRDGKWHAGIAINWPFTVNLLNLTDSSFTDPEHAIVQVGEEGTPFSVADWEKGRITLDDCELDCDIGVNSFLLPRCLQLRYVREIDWTVAFTREEAQAAQAAGEEFIVRKLILSSPAWSHNPDGVEPTTFKIVAKVSDILSLHKLPIKCAQIELPNGCQRELVWRDCNITFFDGRISYRGIPLFEGADYEVEGVRAAKEIGEYTLTIKGINNFEGTIEYTFKIVEPRRPFGCFAMHPIDFNPTPKWERCESKEAFERERDFKPWQDLERHGRRCPMDRRWEPYNPYATYGYFTHEDDTTIFVVTNGNHLAYSLCGDKWYSGMVIDWPTIIDPCDSMRTRLTGPWQARFDLSTRPGVTNCVADIMLDDIFCFSNRLRGETMGAAVGLYRYPFEPLPFEYVDALAWAPAIDIATLQAAKARGDEYVDYILTAGSPAWLCDPDGVKWTKFAIRIPLDIELFDWCEQRWPLHDHDWAFWVDDLNYIAFAECFNLDGLCDVRGQTLRMNFAAPAQTKRYDGEPFVQTLAGLDTYVKKTGAVVDPITYIDLSDGSPLAGAPVEVGMYKAMTTITVRNGAKKLHIETSLTIEPDSPTRPFRKDAMTPIPGRNPDVPIGEVDPAKRELRITCSTNLAYDAESKTWYAGFVVEWPCYKGSVVQRGGNTYWINPQFTDVEHGMISLSEETGELSIGEEQFGWCRGRIGDWQYLGETNAITNVTWRIPITISAIEAALERGETEFVYTLTAGSDRWLGDGEGIEETVFTMVVPIDDLVLTDEKGEQVWPVKWFNIVYKPGIGGQGTMESEKRLCGLSKALTPCAFVNAPLYLNGWSKDGTRSVHFADGQVVKDPVGKGKTLNLTAVWTKNPVVAGDIPGDALAVEVTLVPAGKTVEEGTPVPVYGDSPNFRYVAEFPAEGEYDIVVVITEADGTKTTITQMVTIDEDRREPGTGKLPDAPVVRPEGNWSSTIDNSQAGVFVVIAGGIDEMVKHIVRPEEKAAESEIELRLVSKQMPADDSTYGYAQIIAAKRCACIKPVDLRLEKYLDGEYVQKYRDTTTPPDGSSTEEYNGNIKIVIPFRKEGRVNFSVVRYYEKEEGEPKTGSVDELLELDEAPAKGKEGFVLNETTGTITLYISKFTTYAFVWDGAQVVLNNPMRWEYETGDSAWFGSLDLSCTAGWASSIENLQFVFERRVNDSGTVVAQLMSASKQHSIKNPVVYDGRLYDAIDLPRGEGHFSLNAPEDALWDIVKMGPANRQYVNVDETIINVYQNFRADPSVQSPADLFGWVTYDSYECTYWIPVGSNSEDLLLATQAILKSKRILSAPLSVAGLSATLAYNAVSESVADGCVNVDEFSVGDGVIHGRVSARVGGEKNPFGPNVEAHLLGAKDLLDEYVDLGRIVLDENGAFEADLGETEYRMFKVRAQIINDFK